MPDPMPEPDYSSEWTGFVFRCPVCGRLSGGPGECWTNLPQNKHNAKLEGPIEVMPTAGQLRWIRVRAVGRETADEG